MDERDELQQKIADIGGRYIQRTPASSPACAS